MINDLEILKKETLNSEYRNIFTRFSINKIELVKKTKIIKLHKYICILLHTQFERQFISEFVCLNQINI